MKIYFSRIYSVVPKVFLGHTSIYSYGYLSGTEEPSPWLEALSVKFLEFKVSRLA